MKPVLVLTLTDNPPLLVTVKAVLYPDRVSRRPYTPLGIDIIDLKTNRIFTADERIIEYHDIAYGQFPKSWHPERRQFGT